MLVLGIDPGYAIVGWGVVAYQSNRFVPVGYGSITTPAESPFGERLEKIYRDSCAIIDHFSPESISLEKLFFTNNRTTGIGVAEARGVILLAAQQKGIPVYEYTPMQVKQAVVGYGNAVKSQMQEMTKRLLSLEKVPKPDDTADALAMAICHAHTAGSLLYQINQTGGQVSR